MNTALLHDLGWTTSIDQQAWLADVSAAAERNHPGGLVHIRNHVSKVDGKGFGGRVQHLTLNHRFDYTETVLRSMRLCPTVADIVAKCFACNGDATLAQLAWDQQMASWERTIKAGPMDSGFVSIAPGIQVREDAPGTVYLSGLWVCRTLVDAGKPKPPAKSRPLTLVKAWLRDQSPVGRVRKPRLSAGSFEYIAVAGCKLQAPRGT
tara:strand:+ start:642 stop:1262 length:621 start_codon:yes stop_codon:yes gene_type:complete